VTWRSESGTSGKLAADVDASGLLLVRLPQMTAERIVVTIRELAHSAQPRRAGASASASRAASAPATPRRLKPALYDDRTTATPRRLKPALYGDCGDGKTAPREARRAE
jgi:hypothetical protein